MQCSDWERRPLLSSQLRYASLDSLCLLGIADVLLKRLNSEFRSGGLTVFKNRPFQPVHSQKGDWRKHCTEDWLNIISHRRQAYVAGMWPRVLNFSKMCHGRSPLLIFGNYSRTRHAYGSWFRRPITSHPSNAKIGQTRYGYSNNSFCFCLRAVTLALCL